MDIGTVSLILLCGMLFLLAIGMPLGFASGFLAVVVLVCRFEPNLLTDPFSFGEGSLTRVFGRGIANILSQSEYGITTNYVLISVPLFIFMATLLERSGIARDMYNSLTWWMSRTRGGIAVVTALMAIVMAAMSGIIGGEVVLLGLIALPQMLRLGYNQDLAIGTICASGSLGTMIPPSIVLIFYGLITETSIDALFRAAFLPGFILAGCYIVYILVRTRLHPEQAPLPEPKPDDPTFGEKGRLGLMLLAIIGTVFTSLILLRFYLLVAFGRDLDDRALVGDGLILWSWIILAVSLVHIFVTSNFLLRTGDAAVATAGGAGGSGGYDTGIGTGIGAGSGIGTGSGIGRMGSRDLAREAWFRGKGMVAPLAVVFIVLGSIYGGITGITEAAGVGSFAVFLLICLRGEFSFNLLKEASMRTFKSTGTIIWVTFGAACLAGAYTIAGGPTYVANLILGLDLPTMGVLLVMMVIFLFLGAFMDWTGIVLLVMPVFLPIVLKLPMNEIGLTGGFDSQTLLKVWFGVLFCVNMQVSFLSPPFGPAAFYLKSVAPPHISLPQIFRGFLPFIGLQLLVLALILCVPQVVTVFIS